MTQTDFANADAAEIAKFAALAHHWWDEEGPLRTLHHINPVRLQWMANLATLQDAQVLDVGCGGGILAEALARSGAQVTGIDLAQDALRVAQLHALDAGLESVQYRCIAAEDMARESAAHFDVVSCMEMLEHVPEPAAVVRACAQAARAGAWVFFSTLDRTALSFALAVAAAEYVLRLLPRGTHTHSRFIRPAELAAFARDAGLEVVQIRGLHYNVLTQQARLSPRVVANYVMACRKPL